jgi:hypothetical protein
MRRPSILGGPCHPWLFIEEVVNNNNCGSSNVSMHFTIIVSEGLYRLHIKVPLAAAQHTRSVHNTLDFCFLFKQLFISLIILTSVLNES